MSEDKALELIKITLEEVEQGLSEKVTLTADLVADEILDSLDAMNFLFELENKVGKKMVEFGDDFSDYRVNTLIGIIKNYI